MDKHVTVLGILYIVFSALGILAALIVYIVLVGVGVISEDPEAMRILATVGTVVSFILFFCSIPGVIGGIGLLNRQGWARILVLILGFLKLLNIPVGTALGIYTIWVLFNNETEKLFSVEKIKK
jgi:hypothetical protein